MAEPEMKSKPPVNVPGKETEWAATEIDEPNETLLDDMLEELPDFPPPPLASSSPKKWPRTQKARGVRELAHSSPPVTLNVWITEKPRSITIHPGGGNGGKESRNLPLFARPCPSTPRHGFVESGPISTIQEALELMGRVRDEDPDGEIILMPILTGKYSGVVTNAGITWGPGNDGATGLSNTVLVPSPVPASQWNQYAIGDAHKLHRLGITDCGYVEVVEHDGKVVSVQLRDGPEQSAQTGDFVPKAFTLKRVITPSGVGHDLLKWERLVKRAGKKPGTAALIQTAPNRASHFAIHGILEGMPVIFSEDDNWLAEHLGQNIKASGENVKEKKLHARSYEVLADQIMLRIAYPERLAKGSPYPRERCRDKVVTSVGVCHAMTSWGPEPHLLSLRAEGIVNCLFYTIRACVGEVRHFYDHGPGRASVDLSGEAREMRTDMRTFLSDGQILKVKSSSNGVDRSEVYSNVSSMCLYDQLHLLQHAIKDLHGPGWVNNFGGMSWSAGASLARMLGYALIRFCEKPDEAGWKKCAMYYNRVVNSCHNGGKILTKWCDRFVFICGNEAPALCLMNPVAATSALMWDQPTLSPERIKADFRRQTRKLRT